MPVVYGIERSVMMKLKLTDEIELRHLYFLIFSAPNVGTLSGVETSCSLAVYSASCSLAVQSTLGMCMCERTRNCASAHAHATAKLNDEDVAANAHEQNHANIIVNGREPCDANRTWRLELRLIGMYTASQSHTSF